ncbi:D-alanyl-D-alanine carboxypeptidase [Allorhizobium sp. BGMRC 0089]|uniref:D-alanyl-D-alanine carboxypeptidase family protein n=1 Tax=Allorhizobium sonneratiae TaxID=2934936 RepID=UPI0020334F64|nr:D-alanyl-D-alanine carboxypeptidase family protein [Allorhizobium sonneratiae]MCM2293466.1 D-alanyl-D-alanine carboxypeptidase [Allorhizobium sonneratiae]
MILSLVRRSVAVLALFALLIPAVAAANPILVVDVNTMTVLQHQDSFKKWYPASLTKLMTAYVTFRALKTGEVTLNSEVTMTPLASAQAPSKMYFRPGAKMTLDNALKMMLVKSANDIAMAIAERIGGSEAGFVQRMNAEAARLGLASTHYVNPNGLPEAGQYTSARDLAVLAVTIRREFPQYSGYFRIEAINTGKHVYPNVNMLIGRFDGADGMKTGYICASGYNQVTSATRNGRTLLSVVLGADSLMARADMSADLLQKYFDEPQARGIPLAALRPESPEGLDAVNDISAEICSTEARKRRSETRDPSGRLKPQSPYIHEMTAPPVTVFAGLIPGTEPPAPTPVKNKKASLKQMSGVPMPSQRPGN